MEYFGDEIPTNCLFTGWNSIWNLWTGSLQNASTMLFTKSDGAGSSCWSGSKNLEFVLEAAPAPMQLPLKAGRRFHVIQSMVSCDLLYK